MVLPGIIGERPCRRWTTARELRRHPLLRGGWNASESVAGFDRNHRLGSVAIRNEMDLEDGLVWVYGPGDDDVMAFTDFGIETLVDLIEIHKADPQLLKCSTDPK
jgi:hypothetical protein